MHNSNEKPARTINDFRRVTPIELLLLPVSSEGGLLGGSVNADRAAPSPIQAALVNKTIMRAMQDCLARQSGGI
jgi:hypothetical protein